MHEHNTCVCDLGHVLLFAALQRESGLDFQWQVGEQGIMGHLLVPYAEEFEKISKKCWIVSTTHPFLTEVDKDYTHRE